MDIEEYTQLLQEVTNHHPRALNLAAVRVDKERYPNALHVFGQDAFVKFVVVVKEHSEAPEKED